MSEEKKKSLFNRAVDLVSTRDEKEAVETAQKELQEARRASARAQEALRRSNVAAQTEAKKAVDAAEKRAEEAEKKIRGLEARLRKEKMEADRLKAKEKFAAAEARKVEEAASAVIAEHTVEAGETLSHISLKYYNSAAKPKYMVIYHANQEVIGDNPNIIKPGMVLKIPKLPAELA